MPLNTIPNVAVIGAGLAGSEAAWQLAEAGLHVTLYEMKPQRYTPAHKLPGFAELVCSNSLRSNRLENAVGLLKEELRRLGSLCMQAADQAALPAGGALAVDRDRFSQYVTDRIRSHPRITVVEEEVTQVPLDLPCVVASGPLTSQPLAQSISDLVGGDTLFFHDAVAPIVTYDSIDMDIAFRASRYDRGEADYLNCPMNEAEYQAFYEALCAAQTAEVHEFDESGVFEGCMPIEVMAARGPMTMAYGPLKPVGLRDPRTGKRPFAVVQLRQDNQAGSLYNLVGFQTHLKFPEQKRVFSMIPGLEHAEFVRYGVMHRNTYLNSPGLLNEHYQMIARPNLFFAGQMTGVEGYVESMASGLTAGKCLAAYVQGLPLPDFTNETMIGAMAAYISSPAIHKLEPMNANFGIVADLPHGIKKHDRKLAYAQRSLGKMEKLAGPAEQE